MYDWFNQTHLIDARRQTVQAPPAHPAAPAMQPSSTPRLAPRRQRSLRRPSSERRAEWLLLLAVAALAALAVSLPAMRLPAGYHELADQRSLLGLPHALNVLSSLAFVVAGVSGWRVLRRAAPQPQHRVQRELAGLFLGGLILAGACSAIYHADPGDASLGIDRLGMSLAFASLLGLAAADRVSARAGIALALFVALAAPAAVLTAVASANMMPWTVLQAGGLGLVTVLALRRPHADALALPLLAVVGLYVLAKLAELGDDAVFAATHGLVSGHTIKHLLAALTAWPVVRALQRTPAPGVRRSMDRRPA